MAAEGDPGAVSAGAGAGLLAAAGGYGGELARELLKLESQY